MQPLVLAIEPDLRQAAIVKRIVREKVLADVTVVDSPDAALEAMRTSVPDVLLLSALLSPRDEDELFTHLRTLEHAEHLQTHTIPQLASSIAHGEDRPAKGLLSSLWRRKGSGTAPAGCDPDLFADEITSYLQRASEKKREVRNSAADPAAAVVVPRVSPAARMEEAAAGPVPAPSSWDSPFEWRPATAPQRPAAPVPAAQTAAGPAPAEAGEPVIFAPEPESIFGQDPVVEIEPPLFVEPAAAPEPHLVAAHEPLVVAGPEPVVLDDPEPLGVAAASPLVETPALSIVPPPRLPLVVRHSHEWWYEEGERRAQAAEAGSELEAVLGALAVPVPVAAVGYAEGCRIRRVRLTAA